MDTVWIATIIIGIILLYLILKMTKFIIKLILIILLTAAIIYSPPFIKDKMADPSDLIITPGYFTKTTNNQNYLPIHLEVEGKRTIKDITINDMEISSLKEDKEILLKTNFSTDCVLDADINGSIYVDNNNSCYSKWEIPTNICQLKPLELDIRYDDKKTTRTFYYFTKGIFGSIWMVRGNETCKQYEENLSPRFYQQMHNVTLLFNGTKHCKEGIMPEEWCEINNYNVSDENIKAKPKFDIRFTINNQNLTIPLPVN